MRVTLAGVMSIDGRITAGDNPRSWEWSSKEDGAHFRQLIQQHNVILMGRKTYEAVRPAPDPGKPRYVFTREPALYESQAVPHALEFTDKQPEVILGVLAAQGHQTALVTGGGQINAAFLEANLVDDLYVTIEPLIIGRGTSLVAQGDGVLHVDCSLRSVEQLNAQGSLLAHYVINH